MKEEMGKHDEHHPTAMAMGKEGAQEAFAGIGEAVIFHLSPFCDSRQVAMRWRSVKGTRGQASQSKAL